MGVRGGLKASHSPQPHPLKKHLENDSLVDSIYTPNPQVAKPFTHTDSYPSSYKEVKGGIGMSKGYGGGFALIVVLFILLIIVGASWWY
mgnify:CR=1 FL=1